MPNDLHHIAIFVADIDRAIYLFRDILGFELVWRVPNVGGQKLSALLGIPEMEAELAYLQSSPNCVAVELCRLIRPQMDPRRPPRFGGIGSVVLSVAVEDLDRLHRQLTEEGWTSFTPRMEMRSPKGAPIRVFCIRTEEGLTLELIEKTTAADL